MLLLDFSQLEWLFPDVNILAVKLNVNAENGGKIMIIAGKTIKCKCGDCNFLRLYFYALFMLLLIFICTIKISHDSDRKKQLLTGRRVTLAEDLSMNFKCYI